MTPVINMRNGGQARYIAADSDATAEQYIHTTAGKVGSDVVCTRKGREEEDRAVKKAYVQLARIEVAWSWWKFLCQGPPPLN